MTAELIEKLTALVDDLPEVDDLMAETIATITRLHAEIEALKSDVSDLVRAGSDEATENERLVKERDEARELIAGPMAWLDRWADHVGACAQGDRCTCGLTLARSEISVASRTLEGGEG